MVPKFSRLQLSPTDASLFACASLVFHPSLSSGPTHNTAHGSADTTCRAALLATLRPFLSPSPTTSGGKMMQVSLLFWSACKTPRCAVKSSKHSIPVVRPRLLPSETADTQDFQPAPPSKTSMRASYSFLPENHLVLLKLARSGCHWT